MTKKIHSASTSFFFIITLLLATLFTSTLFQKDSKAFGDHDASSPIHDGGFYGAPISLSVSSAFPEAHVDWSKRYPELDFQLMINPIASDPSSANQENPSQQMTLRLFNSQTNETVKWVTFFMNVSRVTIEDNDGKTTNETESEVLPLNGFQSEDGLRTFLIEPSVADNINGTTISALRQEPILSAWTSEPGKPIVIHNSELLKNGKYHARIEFVVVDLPTVILEERDTLLFDIYWTIDTSHIDPGIKNQVIAGTVVTPTKMPEFTLPATILGISVIGMTLFTILLKKRNNV